MKRSLVVLVVLSVASLSLLGATSILAAGHYNEAPMLQELVAAGRLPSVDERLPEEPFVVGQGVLITNEHLDFEIGKYGGTLRLVHFRVGWNPDTFVMGNEPLLSAPGISVKGIRGNILHSFEVSDDNKTFTFHMRKGLKWSDGVPVTIEDVLYAYEDVLMNKEITPSVPAWLRAGNSPDGEPMKLDVIDDWTFRIRFAQPYGGFLSQLTIVGWRGYNDLLKPKHHLKQFHVRYTPLEKLEPMIREAGFEKGEWARLYSAKGFTSRADLFRPKGLGLPSLAPWVMVSTTPTLVRYERNPYYFKVDPEGNQLPYIDRLRDEQSADVETSNIRVMAGEVDFFREGGSVINLPLYKENEEKGGFRAVLLNWHGSSYITLNHTHSDPVFRGLVRDVRFRRALNMGLNREEILEVIRFGLASLPEIVPSDHDPVKANQLLDEMGLSRRDAEGWRLRPDGKRLVIHLEISSRHPDFVPTSELVVDYWKELGIELKAKTIDSTLRATRSNANELMATMEANHMPIWRVAGGFNSDYLPWRDWGTLWGAWYKSKGKEGEKPPADIERMYELSELTSTAVPFSPESEKGFDELYASFYENVYFFHILENIKQTLLVSSRLGNVPHDGFTIGVNYSVEQMFFKE